MSPRPTPRILAISPGEPLGRLTWSGISHHFLTAVAGTGALVATVDGRADLLERGEKAASWSPASGLRWRQRYHANASPVSTQIRWATTALTAARVRRAGADVDAVLQIGAWYDATRLPGLRGVLRCSYQDGNLMTFLSRPDLELDPASRSVRRAIAYERRLQRRMDLVLTMSEWVRRSMIDDYGVSAQDVVTVGAGPNLARLPAARARADGPPRLLFVGMRFDRKGGHQLIDAFRRVHAQRPDAELWIVGPEQPVSDAAGLRHFGRVRRDTPEGDALIDRLYREASVFVLPSLYEPFGIAFLEAMAYGLPCVGSDCCAMPEIIEQGATGWLVPPGDVEALADRLLDLIADPDRAHAMGQAGRARLLERYTWERVAERVTVEIAARLPRTERGLS